MPISDVEKIVRQEPIENCYEIGKELGRGKFAIVKRCTEKVTRTQYAAKILKKRRRGKSVREDILMEVDIMRQGMDHNRIIKLYEVFESQNEFYIIIELALGGELFRVIAVDPLPEVKARDVVFQILEGVRHLHTLNIIHMDLKPENLLLYRKGSLEIKIVDFGLAVQLQEGQEVKSLVGTAEYVSPEILSFEALSTYSDMWSIGALTYALLAGYSPFQGETHQETFLNVSTCDYDFEDDVFDVVSSEAKDFIEKLLVRTPRKRLTAELCLQHPWIKAHISSSSTTTTNNLDGSMSSLDSALCMDSASSMEPSPVSSASSSFSPAPCTTSRSGGSSVASTTTTTATTSGGTTTVPKSTTTTTAPLPTEFSRPEDMKKVNEKLETQISKLATEQLVADTAAKPRPEGSPTSTASSTSTLRGEEVSEPVVVTTTPAEPPAAAAPAGRRREMKTVTIPREVTDGGGGTGETSLKVKSATLGRASQVEEDRRTASFDHATSKSATLGRSRSPRRHEEGDNRDDGRRTTSFDHTKRPVSPRPKRNNDVTSLDPKTVESIERFQRLKERSKARESESYVQPLTTRGRKELSLDSGPRRSSDGQHLTASQRRLNSKKSLEDKEVTACVSEGGKRSPRGSSSPETKEKTPHETSATPPPPSSNRSPIPPDPTPSPSGAVDVGSKTQQRRQSPASRRKVDVVVSRTRSPASQQSSGSATVVISSEGGGERMKESTTATEEIKEREEKTCPPREEVTTAENSKSEEVAEGELERARKERERAREERKKVRREEEKRREEERKRQREEAERKKEEEKKRMEWEREKAREVRRREKVRKQNSSGSSESLVKTTDKWVWSVEARTPDTTTGAELNGLKPHPQRSESNEETKKSEAAETKAESRSGKKISNASPRSERKTSSEFFQFGIDYTRRRNSNGNKNQESRDQQRISPDLKCTSSPQSTKSPAAKVIADESQLLENPLRTGSPKVVISPSPPPPQPQSPPQARERQATEREQQWLPPSRHHDCSPAAEQRKTKMSRRKTPVISTDALDAILRGEVGEEDLSALHYATEPNPYHQSTLESCPEEDESQQQQQQQSSPRAKRASPLIDLSTSHLAERRDGVLPSALKNPNRPISPEKRRVTLLTTTKERTQSADFDHLLSPERSDLSSSQTPPSPCSPENNFSKSFDASRREESVPKSEGVSRLTVSGSYSSLSRSTPDLSDILGGGHKKGKKDARKVERSNSRRTGIGRSRMDSYVTSTEHSSSYYHSPASPHVMKSARHATVTSRLLSGGKGFLSKLNESSRNTRQNSKVSI